MEARTEPDGYKKIIERGDEHGGIAVTKQAKPAVFLLHFIWDE
jgi:hypothetical protein